MNLWNFIKDRMLKNPKQNISENKDLIKKTLYIKSLDFNDYVIWFRIVLIFLLFCVIIVYNNQHYVSRYQYVGVPCKYII